MGVCRLFAVDKGHAFAFLKGKLGLVGSLNKRDGNDALLNCGQLLGLFLKPIGPHPQRMSTRRNGFYLQLPGLVGLAPADTIDPDLGGRLGDDRDRAERRRSRLLTKGKSRKQCDSRADCDQVFCKRKAHSHILYRFDA